MQAENLSSPFKATSSPSLGDCLNCGALLQGKYCSACAQRSDTGRLDWHWLSHEVQHGIFHVDRGIFFTLKELLVRPGHAIRDYVEGKRKRYFAPFGLIMLLGAISVVFVQWLDIDFKAMSPPTARPGQMQMPDMGEMMSHQTLMYLAMIPFMAVGTWLCLRKYGYNFVEHLVINTYIGALVAIISLITWPLALLHVQMLWLSAIAGLMMLLVTLVVLVQLYRERPVWKVVLRGFAAIAVGFLLVMVATIFLMVQGMV